MAELGIVVILTGFVFGLWAVFTGLRWFWRKVVAAGTQSDEALVDPLAARVPIRREYKTVGHVGPFEVSIGGKPPISDMTPEEFYAETLNDMHNGNWDGARYMLQKVAYCMVRPEITAEQKARFTALMTEFARRDPLYRKTIDYLLPLIRAKPGLMQSDFTKQLGPHEAEALRYVLYFAHELGELMRVKKGRSYQLYPSGVTIEQSS